MVSVEFRGEDERAIDEFALKWTQAYVAQDPESAVLGPTPAFFARLRRQYRYHTIIKSPEHVRVTGCRTSFGECSRRLVHRRRAFTCRWMWILWRCCE
jgi:primosomal protein N'